MMNFFSRRLRRVAALLSCQLLPLFTASTPRLAAQDNADWLKPYPAFTIAGNLHYVGSRDLASYLITTPQGHILINSSLEANVPLIRASVEQLGFKFTDVKILLISHAHWDHAAGSALLKKETGAAYHVMEADVPVVESGGRADFFYGTFPGSLYPPTKVDRVLHDGEEVKLGGSTLVAHLTPGHTPGCTTWTLAVNDAGRTLDAVIVGSPNANTGYVLVGNTRYPAIADDFAKTFRVLKALPCDLFLGAHGAYFDMVAKRDRQKPGAANPFIDPAGYKNFVANRETAVLTELARQKAAQTKTP
jgi:metallo-beta-lactamase class B